MPPRATKTALHAHYSGPKTWMRHSPPHHRKLRAAETLSCWRYWRYWADWMVASPGHGFPGL